MIKVFKINSNNYNDTFLEEWAEKNNVKITQVNVCPDKLYFNQNDNRICDEMELIITIIYNKKYKRKQKINNDENNNN